MSTIVDIPIEAEPIAEPFEVPEYDEYEKAALSYINKVRGILGFGPIESLPRGKRSNPAACVVAQGIRQDEHIVIFQYSMATLMRKDRGSQIYFSQIATPDEKAAHFIVAFDDGCYPQHQR